MPETTREAGSQLLLLLLLQLQKPGKKLHLRRRPKRNRRPSRSRRLMPLLFYLRHNQNNTPRAKAKEKGLGEVPVDQHHQVRRTRRRSLATFTSPSNLKRKEMIVNTVMIRRSSRTTRRAEVKAKTRANPYDREHLPTLQRRLINHVGIGQKANASLVIHVEGVMTPTCSTLLQTPATRLLRHWCMTLTVMMM